MSRSHLNRRQLLQLSSLGLLAVPTSACVGAWRRDSTTPPIAQTAPLPVPSLAQSVSDLSLPVRFTVDLVGETEAGAFGPLPALLELAVPQGDDPNPLLVSLYMAAQNDEELVNGSIFWQSYVLESPQRDEHFSRVEVDGSQVQMQVSPSEVSFRGDVMWFTQLTDSLAEMMGGNLRSGVVPSEGRMTFAIEGNEVTGQMQLTGMSDLGVSSTYQAEFSGPQQ